MGGSSIWGTKCRFAYSFLHFVPTLSVVTLMPAVSLTPDLKQTSALLLGTAGSLAGTSPRRSQVRCQPVSPDSPDSIIIQLNFNLTIFLPHVK